MANYSNNYKKKGNWSKPKPYQNKGKRPNGNNNRNPKQFRKKPAPKITDPYIFKAEYTGGTLNPALGSIAERLKPGFKYTVSTKNFRQFAIWTTNEQFVCKMSYDSRSRNRIDFKRYFKTSFTIENFPIPYQFFPDSLKEYIYERVKEEKEKEGTEV